MLIAPQKTARFTLFPGHSVSWPSGEEQSLGLSPGRDTCFVKLEEVVLSALPARLRIDDTQAYIRMDCKGGNPVSALGVGGNGLWNKTIVAHTLKWPSGLVCLATCIKRK